MASEKTTYELLIYELGQAIQGLIEDLGNPVESPQTTLYFLRSLGWNVPVNTDFSNSPLTFINSLSTIDLENPSDYADLLGVIQNIVSDFEDIQNNLNLTGLTDFGAEFPRQLLDYAVMRHLEYEHPRIFSFFILLGVFDNTYQLPALPGANRL